MAPEEGLEPSTHRLTADCSTIELLWNTEMSRDGRRFSEGASIVSSRFVSSRFLSSRLFPEDEDVLAWKVRQVLHELQTRMDCHF